MARLVLLATLCGALAGVSLCAEDPPKKLTPEERKELEAKWRTAMVAGGKAYQTGKLKDAVKALEESLQHARLLYPKAEFPEGHSNLAMTLNNLAAVYKARRKLVEAEQLCKEGLEMSRRLFKDDHPAVAACLNTLAELYRDLGKLAEAEPLGKESLEMMRRLFKGDHPHLAGSMNNLGLLYQAQGRLTEAEPLCRDSLDMVRRLFPGDHPLVATNLNTLAGLYKAQGRLSEAEPLYRDSLDMIRRGIKGDHPEVAAFLNNLAGLLTDQGKFAEAEPLYKEALEMQRRLFKDDHPELAGSLNNLGVLYQAQGTFAEAEPRFKEALEMQRRLFKGDHPGTAQSLNNLGFVYHSQDQFADAELYYKDALEMLRRLFKGDHPNVGLTLNNLAGLYQNQGKLAEAEQLFKEALAMQRRLYKGDHADTAGLLNNLALLYMAQRKLGDAEPLYKEALEMRRRLIAAFSAQKSEGETLTLLATMSSTRDSFLSFGFQAKAEASTVFPAVWADKASVARLYERRQQAARAVTDPKTAKLLAELIDTRRRRAELLLAPEAKDAATRQQRQDDLKRYESRIGELNREVRPLLPTLERVEKLAQSNPTDLQKVLPGDTAFVDFLRYVHFEYDNSKPAGQKEQNTPRYTAFVVTKDKVSWVDLDTMKAIESAVHSWRGAITSGKEIPAAVPAKVRELIWEKVRKELPANIKTVYIGPDVTLCRVPWAALPGDKPGTILLEDFAIATIPHGTFLLDKLWPQDPIKNPPTGSLVVGGVNYDVEASAGPANRDLPVKPGDKAAWTALPGAAAEASGVTTAAEKKKLAVTALKGEAATPTAILAALPKAKHAHFATHGFFADASFRSAFQLDPKDFEKSWRGERVGRAALSPLVMTGLVFAGANDPKTPGRGIVTGEALVDLDLSGLELAVLSACETGLGDVAGGEGTFGLQRAFHLAGTRNVVASLWKVPDQPTAALMAEFYRNLWTENLSPMESLRQAQLTIYRNPGEIAELAAGFRAGFKEASGTETAIKPTADGKAHPRLWAAFTLSGPGR